MVYQNWIKERSKKLNNEKGTTMFVDLMFTP